MAAKATGRRSPRKSKAVAGAIANDRLLQLTYGIGQVKVLANGKVEVQLTDDLVHEDGATEAADETSGVKQRGETTSTRLDDQSFMTCSVCELRVAWTSFTEHQKDKPPHERRCARCFLAERDNAHRRPATHRPAPKEPTPDRLLLNALPERLKSTRPESARTRTCFVCPAPIERRVCCECV